MHPPAPFSLSLPTGRRALAIRSNTDSNPAQLTRALQISVPPSLFMLSGGSGEMSPETFRQLRQLFRAMGEALAETHSTVIDGGTQFGAVALLGEALAQANHTAPYIGILPAYAEVNADGLTGEAALEPHHSHFILVESSQWGDEVQLMYDLANYLSRQAASVTLLVNGGGISLKEVEQNVEQGREIVVIGGSGRLADEIVTAIRQPQIETRSRVRAVVQSGKITLFDLAEPVEGLVKLLKQRLKSS